VVVDAGENVVNGVPCGDVDFVSARERAGYITPVPGGVGPVTSLMLVKNLIALSKSEAASRGL
jgi:methylenetetrahydrofolate dehydrogenase (NADP+)/methenyltetrahydrofolate cyclohydrolase